ncbi:MAG: hypothetical protein IK025_08780 [Bacteroidales bacterium]|nr:hypothetical protein [Bacteroidales bacterium]
MKKIFFFLMATVAFLLASCDADEETYNTFIGDWHLFRINANGDFRKPFPGGDTCFNLHFMKNNSMIGESVSSSFSAVYNIKKKNKMTWSGFTYLPVAEDSTDNVVFINNMLKVNTYEMRADTLKFFYDKKTYMVFTRK